MRRRTAGGAARGGHRGVGAACVSVRSATEPEVIERVWGNVPHRALEEPSEMARHVTPLFRTSLKEAAAAAGRGTTSNGAVP